MIGHTIYVNAGCGLFFGGNINCLILFWSTGIDSIKAEVAEQKLTVIGRFDKDKLVRRLAQLGQVEIVSAGCGNRIEEGRKK